MSNSETIAEIQICWFTPHKADIFVSETQILLTLFPAQNFFFIWKYYWNWEKTWWYWQVKYLEFLKSYFSQIIQCQITSHFRTQVMNAGSRKGGSSELVILWNITYSKTWSLKILRFTSFFLSTTSLPDSSVYYTNS